MLTAKEFKRISLNEPVTDFSNASAVLEIIERVRKEKDQALLSYARTFDQVELSSLEVLPDKIKEAYDHLDEKLKEALQTAKENIENYQQKIKWKPMAADKLYQKIHPLKRVGIYVPGGKASYPSTVLMTAVLADVAGVEEVIVVTPPQPGGVNQATLAACWLTGVDHVYQAGGAQAIAALAYGTETIPKVDKIVGPGNQYVALAKKLVYGDVGIDSIAGPSEIVIVADETTNAEWAALDILAQAEHDEMARTFLISESAEKITAIEKEIDRHKIGRERRNIIEESLRNHHYPVWTSSRDETIEIVNFIAGEHVSIQTKDAPEYVELVTAAGAVFIGAFAPEAIGDYAAGPSHVLPTGGNARFANGLSVNDFLRTNSVLHLDKETFEQMAPSALTLATEESLLAHRDSVRIRLEEKQ